MADEDSRTAKEVRSLRNVIILIVVIGAVIFWWMNVQNDVDEADAEGRVRARCLAEGVAIGLSDTELERRCGT